MLAAVGLLLLIAASRIYRFSELGMNPDEVWSIWQTFGTPGQILQWTPYDWPPGYFLTLGAWRGFVGQHPISLRYLSVLVFLVGSSFLFRVVRRLHGATAALLVLPAYAALGFSILLSTEVRGYALLLGLLPVAFWLMLRYFDRPTLARAISLALALAALFYVSVTSIGAFLIMGVYALVVYRQKVWRGWLPGVIAGLLAVPEILSKVGVAIARTEATRTLTLPSLPEALRNLYWDYAGYEAVFLIWGILFIAATVLIVYRRRADNTVLAWLLWAVGAPVLMYVLHPLLAFFSVRYAWWIMLGIAVWAAWGLAYLPRRGIMTVALLLTGLMFVPIPLQEYILLTGRAPLETNFTWLRDYLISGDVLVIDAGERCGSLEEWDYFSRTYFPVRLTVVENPAGHRRVWYITGPVPPNADLQAAVTDGRVPGRFVGPPGCLFRLYEAPPDTDGILFENGMRFHGVDVMDGEVPWTTPLVRREGETVRLRLWWSVDRAVDLDYSINTYLHNPNTGVFAQVDGPPQPVYPARAPMETSRWQLGSYIIEERELVLKYPTPKTNFGIYLVVYFWADGKRIPAPGTDADTALLLRTLRVMSY